MRHPWYEGDLKNINYQKRLFKHKIKQIGGRGGRFVGKSCFAGSLRFCTNWFPITVLKGRRFLVTLESLLFENSVHFLSLALLACWLSFIF